MIKATPNPSRKYGETVCCAGITAEGKWKRLFPIRFRQLQENKFRRWDWVSFDYTRPKSDSRSESCHVYEDRLIVDGSLKPSERVSLLNPLILPSTAEAAARNMSLALIRPVNPRFKFRRKPPAIVDAERSAYHYAARQLSLLDKEQEAFEPVPYAFAFTYEDATAKHTMQCGDWETSATFWKMKRDYGEQQALDHLMKMFNEEYPRKGMAFAMGTLKKRPSQWMLLGVLRLDEPKQGSLF